MHRWFTLRSAAHLAALFGMFAFLMAGSAFGGDSWADTITVNLLGTGGGLYPCDTNSARAVDGDITTYCNMGVGGIVTVRFTDNIAVNDSGNDIKIYDCCNVHDEKISVAVSQDGFTFVSAPGWASLGPGASVEIDLADVGLSSAIAVKITDVSAGNNGWDLSMVDALHWPDITKEVTGGPDPILLSQASSQALNFQISVANSTGSPLDLGPFAFRDTVPAEFDLDPDAEDSADGSDDDVCADTVCDGVDISDQDCSDLVIWRSSGATKGKQPKLEPEHLQFQIAGSGILPDGEACVLTVYIKTDENPASARDKKATQYEPTSCPAGGAIYVNDGVTVIDTLTGAVLSDPMDPQTVACPACADHIDNDGDGLTDYPADPGCTDQNDNDEANGA